MLEGERVEAGFEGFLLAHGDRLKRALVAAYGSERGAEATAEALAYAWEHRERVLAMEHPVAYLYRVGQSRTRWRKRRVVFEVPDGSDPWIEPALVPALAALTERQRVAVVLVHGFGWELGEVGEILDIKVTSVQNHVERGLAKLRNALEVS
ncbi:MAG: sigma factor-like helix-turn-helix DNA-binding protein [Acidimicrobiia bacterium]